VALCLLPASARLSAQAIVLPKNIIFTGAPAYSQAELLAFTGLKPGATSSAAEVQAAAQKLSDTGLFADVHFQSGPQGLTYALKPMPADNLLPARFPNLVWWSNAELDATLKTRVPLYRGSIPISGNLQDSVSAALTAMLAEKNIHAKVSVMPSGAAPGAPPTAYSFLIESPEVRVHSVTFAAASPAMQAKLERVSKDASGQPFDQYTTNSFITSRVTELYRNDGYLDATIQAIARSAPQVSPDAINLDLTATIHEGEPYRILALTWPGSDVMSAADFNKQVKLHPEDIASQTALKDSLRILARAYYAKGYQDAKIQAPATLDAATHHVAYNIRVVPGPQYRIKSINAVGLNEQQRKDFNAAWHMNPGDFYDVTYLTSFLLKNSAIQSLRGYSATYKAVSDPDTHLVDLTLTFVKGGSLVQATD
jgi:outer membrane protein insertion porin family